LSQRRIATNQFQRAQGFKNPFGRVRLRSSRALSELARSRL
jgi:hypothetical protein